MALDTVLAGIAGGLQGLNAGYADERHSQDNERKLAMQDEIARLRADVMQKIAELNAGSRERVAGTTADSRRDVAETNAGARRDVAETGAAVTRRGQDLNYSIAGDKNDTTRRGQDITSANSVLTEMGRNSRWAAPSGNAKLGANVSTRGQDLNFSLGSERNALAERGQDVGVDVANAAEAGRTRRAAMRPSWSLDSLITPSPSPTAAPVPPAAPPPTAAPVVKPPSVVQQRGAIPVTPRATAPASVPGVKPAAAPPAVDLANQIRTALAAFNAEKDPARKQALARQLADLRAQVQAARGAK